MTEALSLRQPTAASLMTVIRPLTVRMKVTLVEGLMSLEMRKYTHEEKAEKIKNEVLGYLTTNYGQYKPEKESREKKEEVALVIAETHEEAARSYITHNEDYEVALIDFTDKKAPQYGAYNRENNRVILDMENIRGVKGGKEFQEVCFYMTVAHEVIHSEGGFEGRYKGLHKLRWLDEGITEHLARDIALELYNRIVSGKFTPTYESEVSAVNHLMMLVGEETVLEGFCSRRLEPIVKKLNVLGFSEEQIDGIFRLGSRLPSNLDDFTVHMRPMHDRMAQMRHEEAEKMENEKLRQEVGNAYRNLNSSYGAVAAEHATNELAAKLWKYLEKQYGEGGKDVAAPKILFVEPKRELSQKEKDEILTKGSIFTYVPEKNELYVFAKKFLEKGKDRANLVGKEIFNLYLMKKTDVGAIDHMPYGRPCALALASYFWNQLVEEIGFGQKEIKHNRELILGRKLVGMMGTEAAIDWLFGRNNNALKDGFEKVFGKDSHYLDLEVQFFDEPITNFAMLLTILEKKPNESTVQTDFVPAKLTYGNFAAEFEKDQYRATLRMASQMFPEFNDENKSALACSVLYFCHLSGSLDSASAALTAMTLQNAAPSVLSMDFYSANQEGAPQIYLNSAVLGNIMNDRPLFESIETAEALNEKYKDIVERGLMTENSMGVSPIYATMFRELTERVRGEGIREFEGQESKIGWTPELDEKIDAYVDKLCKEFSSEIYREIHSDSRFKAAYRNFLENMVGNFVLGVSKVETGAEVEKDKILQADGLNYVNIAEMINAPLLSGPAIRDVTATPEGVFVQPPRHGLTENYFAALQKFVSSPANKGMLQQDTVIHDASRYHTKEAEAWVQSVLNDSAAMNTFLDMAATGIECCGSRVFISV